MVEIPTLNIEYIFYLLYTGLKTVWSWTIGFFQAGGIWWIAIVSGLITVLFVVGIIYFVWRIFQLRKEERAEASEVMRNLTKADIQRNEEWDKILALMNSDNPSDWKLAIIEADVLLDELVTRMGYKGDNLGEKLKTVEPSDFLTLDLAWEAHKVRNAIAHQGGYTLTKREARRVIDLFQKVFEEFHFV